VLRIRVVSPPGSTERLVDRLGADPGVRNLVVLPGAARHPDGDAVQFELLTRFANPLLRELRVAGLIGAVGILTNSQILIVAAMVVGPEYGVIIATALGINHRDHRAVRRGLFALMAGFAMAVLATLLFGLIIRGTGNTPRLYELGVRPVSALINSPNLFSAIVAVLAGIVGVVSLTESRANALIGVFISVTTIPAADMGLSAAYGSWSQARGSTLQLLLNVVLLIAVGAGGLRLQRFIWRTRTAKADARPAGTVLLAHE
jgi:uncharacterized hydrophobic protein (TIGR00271 family)